MSPQEHSTPEVNRHLRASPGGEDGPEAERNRTAPLADFLGLLWRRRVFVVGGTALCGLAALLTSVTAPRVYESRATLIVTSPLIAKEISSPPLSVATYRVLFQSDYIIDRARNEMATRGVIPPDTALDAVKRMVWVETYKDAKDAPLLEAWAKADSGEKAMRAANTWAEVFVREIDQFARKRIQESVRTVEAQYPTIQATVAEAEARLRARQDHWEEAAFDLDGAWERRLVAFSKETEELCRDHEMATARSRLEFETRWNLDLLAKQLSAQETALLGLEQELLESTIRVQVKRDLVAKIKEEVQTEPRYLVLSKAISDEALWEKTGSPNSSLPDDLDQVRLRSELMNPVYQDLLSRLTTAQLELDELERTLAYLPGEIERLRQSTGTLRTLVGTKQIELSELAKGRELELKNLRTDRDAQMTALRKAFDKEVGQLDRRRDYELEALTREARAAREAFTSLATKNQSVQLARLEEEASVKIGALAVAPQWPSRPKTLLNVVTAFVVGLILCTMLVILVEYLRATSGTGGGWGGRGDPNAAEALAESERSKYHSNG